MPVKQRLVVGAEYTVVPLAEPHAPLVAPGDDLLAVQLAVAPPLEPVHVHVVDDPVDGKLGYAGLDVPVAQ